MPTKSQILTADPQRVLDLIDGWKITVAALEQHAETYLRYVQRPGGSPWDGRTADATKKRGRQDFQAITAARDALDSAAQQIRNTISSALMPPLGNAKQIIANAESYAGVHISEDLSIDYTPPAGTSKQTVDANAKIVADAEAELKADAATWWAAEFDVANQIREAESAVVRNLNMGAALYDPRRAMPWSSPAGQPPGVSQTVFPPTPLRPQPGDPADLGDLLGAGGAEPTSGPPRTWQEALLPAGAPGAPAKGEGAHATGSLSDFLDQLKQGGVPPGWRVPIPAQDIETFKALARETLRRDGVPSAEIEQQLDAAVTRAQEGYGLIGNRVPQPQARGVSAPGFAEGFADRWHATEQLMRNLFGTGEPGDPGVVKSWAGLAEGVAEAAVTPPVAGIARDFLESPNPAYFAGGAAADAALTAPSLLFGGEGAMVRAGLPAEIVTDGGAPLSVLRGWDPAGGLSWQDFEARFGVPESRIWPGNDGFPPTYVPQPAHLPEGTIIDRFGSPFGQYLAPDGTPFADRALMPESAGSAYNRYMVTGEPLPPGWRIVEGPVEPWFGQTPSPGARQYMILAPEGVRPTVSELVRLGILDGYGPPLGR